MFAEGKQRQRWQGQLGRAGSAHGGWRGADTAPCPSSQVITHCRDSRNQHKVGWEVIHANSGDEKAKEKLQLPLEKQLIGKSAPLKKFGPVGSIPQTVTQVQVFTLCQLPCPGVKKSENIHNCVWVHIAFINPSGFFHINSDSSYQFLSFFSDSREINKRRERNTWTSMWFLTIVYHLSIQTPSVDIFHW